MQSTALKKCEGRGSQTKAGDKKDGANTFSMKELRGKEFSDIEIKEARTFWGAGKLTPPP